MARPGKPSEDEFLHALYQGGELLAAGRVIEAKDHLERAFQLQPTNEKAQNLLGLAYFKLGLFDRAAEIYESLVRENPADPTLRVNLGLVYLKTNATARAVREFETATDLAPEHTRAHNYLGIALAQAGEYGRARDHFLLAGSDQMAEKMRRAIAGEGFVTPPPAPAAGGAVAAEAPTPESAQVSAPVQTRFAEPATPPGAPVVAAAAAQEEGYSPSSLPSGGLNGAGYAFVHREQVGPEEGGDLVADAVEEPPAPEAGMAAETAEYATSAEYAAGPPAGSGLQGQDWGSHFGFDGTRLPEAGAGAEALAGVEVEAIAAPEGEILPVAEVPQQEISLSTAEISDGGAIAVARSEVGAGEDQFDAAFSEPPPAEVVGVEEMPEEAVPLPEVPAEMAPMMEGRAAIESVEVIEVPATPPPPVPSRAEVPVSASVSAPASVSASAEVPEIVAVSADVEREEAQPQTARGGQEPPPNFALVRPPGTHQPSPRRPLEVSRGEVEAARPGAMDLPIAELAPKVAMFAGEQAGPFLIEPDAVAIVVQGELLTRVVGLVAQSGQLELEPQNRRYRGRTTDKPFGEGEAQLMRVTGRGRLVVQVPKRTLVSVDLDDESAYFLEGAVFAFEEPVAFENGRVPSEVAPDLDLVHLRGKGRVLLTLPGALRSLPVTEQEPVTIPLTNMVGWHGNLSPKVIALAKDRSGKPLRAGIELSGEGFALLSMGGS